MKKLLNTLYVTTEGMVLSKDGENIVARLDGEEQGRAPFHMLGSLVAFGAIAITPALMQACASAGICVVLLDRTGRFQARIEGPVSGNVLLRRAQYTLSEHAPTEIAQGLVLGKIGNQRAVLMRSLRDHGTTRPEEQQAALRRVVKRLGHLLRQISTQTPDLDTLRGKEEDAAAQYFSVFDHLLRNADPDMRFKSRSRRPPLDRVNAVLSFLYTLLTHDCRAAAEAVGLDPAVGFLHRDRPGRPSLALDLMEELRPVLADRMALSLINRRQIGPADFDCQDGGAVLLNEQGRRTVLTAWQTRKGEGRRHDFLEENAPLGLVPYLQAQLLARRIRGDLDAYPPWFWS